MALATRRPRRASERSRPSARRRARRTAAKGRRQKWSQHVTRTSNALDLEANVFKLRSATAVAASLKRSALRSRRRKASSYQSALSMLNFYINRAGKGLNPSRRRVLERAKGELRKAFGREPGARRPRR
ncbi:MAG: DUF3175 domain-containing protein [Chloroflexi bacterium]|nr:MAG: DUF3175 domain-containing protein [Chloroflexota bacterium]